jgi:hypothetical protein
LPPRKSTAGKNAKVMGILLHQIDLNRFDIQEKVWSPEIISRPS